MTTETIKNQHSVPSIAAQCEQEWLAVGVTAEEWQQMEQISRIEEILLASGRAIEDINAEWEIKSAEQIIKEYADLPESRKLGKSLPLPAETEWQCATFLEFVTTPTPKMKFHVSLILRGGITQEYDQEALVVDSNLLEILATLQTREMIEVRLRMHFGEKVPNTLIALRIHQPQSEQPYLQRRI